MALRTKMAAPGWSAGGRGKGQLEASPEGCSPSAPGRSPGIQNFPAAGRVSTGHVAYSAAPRAFCSSVPREPAWAGSILESLRPSPSSPWARPVWLTVAQDPSRWPVWLHGASERVVTPSEPRRSPLCLDRPTCRMLHTLYGVLRHSASAVPLASRSGFPPEPGEPALCPQGHSGLRPTCLPCPGAGSWCWPACGCLWTLVQFWGMWGDSWGLSAGKGRL